MAQEDEGFSATALPGEVDGDAAVGAAKKALAMASEEADDVGRSKARRHRVARLYVWSSFCKASFFSVQAGRQDSYPTDM